MSELNLTDMSHVARSKAPQAAEVRGATPSTVSKQAEVSRSEPVSYLNKVQNAEKVGKTQAEDAAQNQSAEEKKQALESAVSKLNEFVQTVQRDLQFQMDEESGKSIITVVDRHSQEVVRQIPDETALKLARNLQDKGDINLFEAEA